MILKIESCYTKRQKLKEWHTYFAWFPIRVSGNEVIWLEKVKRRLNFYVDRFEYEKILDK